MEKEQKKLLLVAVSVGVFLLVTITVAIIMLTPKVNNEQAAFSSPYPISSGRIQPADSINTPAQPVITNSQETNINVNRENSASAATVAAGRNNGEHLTIQIPRPTTAAVPTIPILPRLPRQDRLQRPYPQNRRQNRLPRLNLRHHQEPRRQGRQHPQGQQMTTGYRPELTAP